MRSTAVSTGRPASRRMPAACSASSDAPVVVLAEVDVVEPVAVAQPGLGAVARMQEGERGADRQALVAHRREDEHLVERPRSRRAAG
jgi:hypothetical protein